MRGTELILPLAFLIPVLLIGCYGSYHDNSLDDSGPSPDPRVDPAFEPPPDPRPDPRPDGHVDPPDPCSPSRVCEDIECGWDEECDVDCGPCPTGLECFAGTCSACAPGCDGRSCGVDICGNPYGSCADGEICDHEGECVDASYIETCSYILEESLFCLTKSGSSNIAVIGIDSGTVCRLPIEVDLSSEASEGSLAWIDDELYICRAGSYSDSLTRISLRDGSVETAPVPCQAVARYGSGIIVESAPGPPGITYYDSFADAKEGDGTRMAVDLVASRMTAFCDTLYTAWHSTDEIDVYSLPDGEHTGTIELEDYHGLVWGMSVTEDGRLLLINEPENRIAIFDVNTGESLGNIYPGMGYHGLACATKP